MKLYSQLYWNRYKFLKFFSSHTAPIFKAIYNIYIYYGRLKSLWTGGVRCCYAQGGDDLCKL